MLLLFCKKSPVDLRGGGFSQADTWHKFWKLGSDLKRESADTAEESQSQEGIEGRGQFPRKKIRASANGKFQYRRQGRLHYRRRHLLRWPSQVQFRILRWRREGPRLPRASYLRSEGISLSISLFFSLSCLFYFFHPFYCFFLSVCCICFVFSSFTSEIRGFALHVVDLTCYFLCDFKINFHGLGFCTFLGIFNWYCSFRGLMVRMRETMLKILIVFVGPSVLPLSWYELLFGDQHCGML